jgi:hypothetical protein
VTGGTEHVAALRSAVVATVLAGAGFRVIDLGAGLTPALLRASTHTPTLTWLVDGETVDLGGYRVRTMSELSAYARGVTTDR